MHWIFLAESNAKGIVHFLIRTCFQLPIINCFREVPRPRGFQGAIFPIASTLYHEYICFSKHICNPFNMPIL